jgi:hypothetical protein
MTKIKCPNCHTEFELREEERVDIKGWKGKSDIDVYEQQFDYRTVEHRKNKETGESYDDEHLIPKENVKMLWDLLRQRCKRGFDYKYKFLVRVVLSHYRFHEKEKQEIETFMEAFNGGQWRAKYFFPYLYYPLKILESKGLLIYYGRGGVQRISDDDLL